MITLLIILGIGDNCTTLTIQAKDKNGKPVVNIPITLSANYGSLSQSCFNRAISSVISDRGFGTKKITVNTDYSGEAEFAYIPPDVNAPLTDTITAKPKNGNSIVIKLPVIKIGSISLNSDKQNLGINDTILLTIKVLDVYGKPVGNVKVNLRSSNKDVLQVGVPEVKTNSYGIATVFVTSAKNLSRNSNVQIIATCGDKSRSIKFSVFVPQKITLDVVPNSINVGDTATLIAKVTDSMGNPVPGISVTFSSTSTSGSISVPTVKTDINGEAVTHFVAGSEGGNVTVKAEAGSLNAFYTFKVVETNYIGNPQIIKLINISSHSIYIKGSGENEYSTLTFQVTDGGGNVIPNTVVKFSLIGGSKGGEYLVPISAVTDKNGTVTTTLKAGIKPGVVKIEASCGGVTSEISKITINSGPPDGMHFSLSPAILNIPGLVYDGVLDNITARLADKYSNPVPANTSVHFESEYSKIIGADTTTDSGERGVASAILSSQDPRPQEGKPVHVWAESQTGDYGFISDMYVNSNVIYIGTDGGGVFRSLDGGESWENIGKPRSYYSGYKGLWGTYIYDLDVDSVNNIIAVATNDGVFVSIDEGYNWENLGSGSSRFEQNVNIANNGYCVNLDYYPLPLRERITVKRNGNIYLSYRINGRQFCVKDSGTYDISYDIDYNEPYAPARIVKIYNDNGTVSIFAYFYGRGLYKYDYDHKRWNNCNSGLQTFGVTTVSTLNGNIYVTENGKLYKSSVNSCSFTKVLDNQNVMFNDSYVADSKIYFATTNGIKIFDSSDNSVKTINLSFEDNMGKISNIKKIAVDEDGNIYVATDFGAYRVEQDGKVYPLNYYREIYTTASDTRTLTLKYPSDQDKSHTIIYVNGVEMPSTYYKFDNATSISLINSVDNITEGSTVEIRYALKANGDVDPRNNITSLYFYNGKLYIGSDGRELYELDDPDSASNGELPELKNIEGNVDKITSVIYATTEVMFSGRPRIDIQWDSDGDGYMDGSYLNGDIMCVPKGKTVKTYVFVTDQNGRPLSDNRKLQNLYDYSYDYELNIPYLKSDGIVTVVDYDSYSSLPDSIYGGYGVTEFTGEAVNNINNSTVSSYMDVEVDSYNGKAITTLSVFFDNTTDCSNFHP